MKRNLKTFFSFSAVLIIVYFGLMAIRRVTVVDGRTELTTAHFVINYQGIYEGEARQLAGSLERHYNRIRGDLQDPAHSVVRVFVHSSQAEFNEGTGLTNSTANGTSRGPDEFHIVWTNWFNSILPDDPIKVALHEFTHCVQLNILIMEAQEELGNASDPGFDRLFEEKFRTSYPQWFWEAICDYEAGIVSRFSVRYGMDAGLTLKELNESHQIYNVGYTLIEYIVAKWGREKLPLLVRAYADIESVLGVSAEQFEQGWVEYVYANY